MTEINVRESGDAYRSPQPLVPEEDDSAIIANVQRRYAQARWASAATFVCLLTSVLSRVWFKESSIPVLIAVTSLFANFLLDMRRRRYKNELETLKEQRAKRLLESKNPE